jgi:hypothetical protein
MIDQIIGRVREDKQILIEGAYMGGSNPRSKAIYLAATMIKILPVVLRLSRSR